MQIKHGVITEVNDAEAMAKVTFEDEDDLVSYDLPIIHHSMGFAKFYSMPKVGMTALCGFLEETGIEDGFIIGSFYNDENKPGKTGQVHYVQFDDGALIEYDESAKKLTLKSGGGGVFIDDNVTITGTVKSGGDMVAGSISLQNHLTTGVKSGGDLSGGPQ